MNITYITHSCFLVELDRCYLLFDYYRGKLPKLKEDKPLYVFASHVHADHYSNRIFKLKHTQTTWMLSSDIVIAHPHIQVEAGQCYTVDDLKLRTLASTDAGVAFLVSVQGSCIYHAGDLNWWDWGDEDSPQESAEMKERYFRELQSIQGMHFDVAFVPVDPRLKERALKGVRAFLQYASCDVLIPMHFWKDSTIFTQLRNSEIASIKSMQIWLGFQELETFTKG